MTTPKPEDVEARARETRAIEAIEAGGRDRGQYVKAIAAALLSERVATARACAKAICFRCAEPRAVLALDGCDDGGYFHHRPGAPYGIGWERCAFEAGWRAFPEAIPGKGEE